MKTKKRLLSVLLSLALLLGLIPGMSLTAYADGGVCPHCGSTNYEKFDDEYYSCNSCGDWFVAPVEEVAEDSSRIGSVYHTRDTLPKAFYYDDDVDAAVFLKQELAIYQLRGCLVDVDVLDACIHPYLINCYLYFRPSNETARATDAVTAVKISSGGGSRENPYQLTPQYPVSFNANGGSPAPSSQQVWRGDKVTKPDDPTSESGDFAGWYNGNSAWDFDQNTVDYPITLTAHWAVPVTSVTLPATASVDVDAAVSLTATIEPSTATDKKVKWSTSGGVKLYTDADCTTEVGADATENLTVYAKGISAGDATVTATSNADGSKNASCAVTVNEALDPVPYMKWDGEKLVNQTGDKACKDYTVVTSSTTTFENGKWYVVNAPSADNLTIADRITVSGTVNLILVDGAKLTAGDGIAVTSGNTLNIYAQSTGSSAGAVNATATTTGSNLCAGIGGNKNGFSGTINIHGGQITALGNYGAGIGSGGSGGAKKTDTGTVNIYGGTVNATGGTNAAGIGGGQKYSCGSVNIYDGNVTATGCASSSKFWGGAGIGGGSYGNGGSVAIYGGTVKANGGGGGGVGIGKGEDGSSNGTLTIGDGLAVYGGDAPDPTTVITKQNDDYARYRYMKVDTAPHTVTLTGGANAQPSGGALTQENLVAPMTDVVYTANTDYYFAPFDPVTTNGITVTRSTETTVTVSGTPTADANIVVPDAVLIPTSDYTLVIPATLSVQSAGWNGTDGIKVNNENNNFDTTKKLTVTATSANDFALKSGENSIGYKLAAAAEDTEATTVWTFTAAELNSANGKTEPMGIIVEDYTGKPGGTYQDTVMFTGTVENTAKTINIDGVVLTYADEDTWGAIVTQNSTLLHYSGDDICNSSNHTLFVRTGEFTVDRVRADDPLDTSKSYLFIDTSQAE